RKINSSDNGTKITCAILAFFQKASIKRTIMNNVTIDRDTGNNAVAQASELINLSISLGFRI
ncbi:hypothetical protein, partial [Bacillus toyonensis]|uniref:hypothetical protein n=1 Tax=Bacillus toyonensis TaxID=155322 RepID=UPI001C3F3F4D